MFPAHPNALSFELRVSDRENLTGVSSRRVIHYSVSDKNRSLSLHFDVKHKTFFETHQGVRNKRRRKLKEYSSRFQPTSRANDAGHRNSVSVEDRFDAKV